MTEFEKVRMVRAVVGSVLQEQEDDALRRSGYIHLYGVSEMSTLLAARRGLDVVTASVAGMLHDIYTCRTGLQLLHAASGAEDARVILRDLGVFSPEEQQRIHSAILRHSDKARVDGSYDELLKDADVLQHYLYDPTQSFPPAAAERIRNVAAELGLPAAAIRVSETMPIAQADSIGLGARLANIAEELARRPLIGNKSQSGPDVWPLIRYPGVSCRFAAVPAWLEWAKLPEIGFFHRVDEPGFAPERGDLVIYDRLVSDAEHDHIGVLLGLDDCVLIVAEGNVNNRSGISRRHRFQQVNGFIRVEDSYRYSWP